MVAKDYPFYLSVKRANCSLELPPASSPAKDAEVGRCVPLPGSRSSSPVSRALCLPRRRCLGRPCPALRSPGVNRDALPLGCESSQVYARR